MPVRGENSAVRRRPLSITTVTPSIVRLDSAIDVASTTLRLPVGAAAIARCCCCAGSAPYSGVTSTPLGTVGASARSTRRISFAPGKKTSKLPSWRSSALRTARVTVCSKGAWLAGASAYLVSTGYARPWLRITAAPPNSVTSGSAFNVADMTSSRKSLRSSSWLCSANANPISPCKFRSWNSSKIMSPTPIKAGSCWSIRVRMPSVTTVILVRPDTLLSVLIR
ncbi:hypothetical protein D3C77_277150 [compost metagenome]